MKEELSQIYRLYAEDVYRYALSICADPQLAQDVLQDTMLKALTEFGKFRGDCSVKTLSRALGHFLPYFADRVEK